MEALGRSIICFATHLCRHAASVWSLSTDRSVLANDYANSTRSLVTPTASAAAKTNSTLVTSEGSSIANSDRTSSIKVWSGRVPPD